MVQTVLFCLVQIVLFYLVGNVLSVFCFISWKMFCLVQIVLFYPVENVFSVRCGNGCPEYHAQEIADLDVADVDALVDQTENYVQRSIDSLGAYDWKHDVFD